MNWREEVTEGDIIAIRKMVAESGVFSTEEIDVAAELAEDRYKLGKDSHYHFLLADVNGALAGYTCYGRIPLTDERYDLYWIVVDQNAQRKRVASELMNRTETTAKALGAKILYAETSSRAIYAPAQTFYLKSGFTEHARLKDFYKKDDDKVIFGKKL